MCLGFFYRQIRIINPKKLKWWWFTWTITLYMIYKFFCCCCRCFFIQVYRIVFTCDMFWILYLFVCLLLLLQLLRVTNLWVSIGQFLFVWFRIFGFYFAYVCGVRIYWLKCDDRNLISFSPMQICSQFNFFQHTKKEKNG